MAFLGMHFLAALVESPTAAAPFAVLFSCESWTFHYPCFCKLVQGTCSTKSHRKAGAYGNWAGQFPLDLEIILWQFWPRGDVLFHALFASPALIEVSEARTTFWLKLKRHKKVLCLAV